jgi:hypothetical protein
VSPRAAAFDHLLSLSDELGTFEHADHDRPRRDHGYCTDDMARVLIVVARERAPTPELLRLGVTAFRFLADAQGPTGAVRNRRTAGGRWQGRRGVDDCWGRTVCALGTTVRLSGVEWMRQSAAVLFDRAIERRSPSPRAMAFAALGAAEVLVADPGNRRARPLLADAVTVIDTAGTDAWPWPEARLSYANAVLPEALIVAGVLLDRPDVLGRGLDLLRWLLDHETAAGHLSPTAVGGAGPGDLAPAFDQQPIEAATMAAACARAAAVTGDAAWLAGVELAQGWFDGRNDAGVPMQDPVTGGGYDGLEASGPNLNQGAESTLALISTMQTSLATTAAA